MNQDNLILLFDCNVYIILVIFCNGGAAGVWGWAGVFGVVSCVFCVFLIYVFWSWWCCYSLGFILVKLELLTAKNNR